MKQWCKTRKHHTQIHTIHKEDLKEELPNVKSKKVALQGSYSACGGGTKEEGERSWRKQYKDPINSKTDFKAA